MASDEPPVALEKRPELAGVFGGRHLVDLPDELLVPEGDLDRFVEESERSDAPIPISTDDNLYLEYTTPKGNVLNYDASLRETRALLERYRTLDVRARHLGP